MADTNLNPYKGGLVLELEVVLETVSIPTSTLVQRAENAAWAPSKRLGSMITQGTRCIALVHWLYAVYMLSRT